ncbi:unnamed protein product [Vitrella brassicaformis CCMP3155]|uniref:Uncharacterized protein n=1 Tax=Vitrella brassicaformis (strain CCMP3155) TaxID=1169540 RepID=A0A0G4FQJ4_VITBC|nr:unnamed protein product [Vitrella brassicaformis CCMP3155]|eukprot:CEM16704.1 unnamed protein product [Vitrella brassicaformis CCMP3155]
MAVRQNSVIGMLESQLHLMQLANMPPGSGNSPVPPSAMPASRHSMARSRSRINSLQGRNRALPRGVSRGAGDVSSRPTPNRRSPTSHHTSSGGQGGPGSQATEDPHPP